MPIKLLALDLDGTLLNSRGEVSERNRRAIEASRTLGVYVALVTGRRFRDARPLALELGLDVPVISHNGALTKHARTLETVNATLLPVDAAQSVLHVGRTANADAMVSDDPDGKGVLLYERLGDNNHSLARYIAWSRRIHGDEADEAIRQVPSLEEYLDHAPVHISFSGSCAAMESLNAKLANELGATVKVLNTIYPKLDFTLIDILNPNVSKGVGVAATASEYGLSVDEVMAVGDNYNDLEMLEFAGTGVLMGNADSVLRERDRFYVTGGNDEDGVAQAIERFILN